jgi:integrase
MWHACRWSAGSKGGAHAAGWPTITDPCDADGRDATGRDQARYAGHSLRAGLATSTAAAGASERVIMSQTGHRSTDMVRRYIREGSLFRREWTNLWQSGALL